MVMEDRPVAIKSYFGGRGRHDYQDPGYIVEESEEVLSSDCC